MRPLHAQQPTSLFNGTDLTGWKAEFTQAEVREGALRVADGSGWVRTERPLSDFVLRLDVRLTEKKGAAGVYLRGWPTFDSSSAPNNAYRLRLIDGKVPAAGEWTQVEIECVGRTVRVRMNGALVSTSDALGNPQGYVALWSSEGSAEFRGIEVSQLSPPPREVPPNTFAAGGAVAVSIPRVISNPKPKYTPDAMRARIAGTVSMSAVVLPNGTVGDVVILRSLDPNFGLDDQAVGVVKQWRFSPGTKDGVPVPVRVAIDLDFNLR